MSAADPFAGCRRSMDVLDRHLAEFTLAAEDRRQPPSEARERIGSRPGSNHSRLARVEG